MVRAISTDMKVVLTQSHDVNVTALIGVGSLGKNNIKICSITVTIYDNLFLNFEMPCKVQLDMIKPTNFSICIKTQYCIKVLNVLFLHKLLSCHTVGYITLLACSCSLALLKLGEVWKPK